jgi:hypothetical protein
MSFADLSVSCRCPACRATQDWSEECRRCGADMWMLREVAQAAEAAQRNCLLAVASGQYGEARHMAKRLVRLRPNERATQLLAVCHLLCEDFHAAMELAK